MESRTNFMKHFWNELKNTPSIIKAGELRTSKKQAVIKLIGKNITLKDLLKIEDKFLSF